VLNATFSNISAISWRPVLVVEAIPCSNVIAQEVKSRLFSCPLVYRYYIQIVVNFKPSPGLLLITTTNQIIMNEENKMTPN
jgi:hypothetical protein